MVVLAFPWSKIMELTTFTHINFLKVSKLIRKIFLWVLKFYHFLGYAKGIRKNKNNISIEISCHLLTNKH